MKKQNRKVRECEELPMHRVRLPGFLIEDQVGLGDIMKKMSYAMGIKPCSGCETRAAALNRWITFTK
jgi:hypothetical protein